ncbi:MAG: hypothetical protein ACHQ3P_08560 [Candidatus Limnocylindrales bacterium]
MTLSRRPHRRRKVAIRLADALERDAVVRNAGPSGDGPLAP